MATPIKVTATPIDSGSEIRVTVADSVEAKKSNGPVVWTVKASSKDLTDLVLFIVPKHADKWPFDKFKTPKPSIVMTGRMKDSATKSAHKYSIGVMGSTGEGKIIFGEIDPEIVVDPDNRRRLLRVPAAAARLLGVLPDVTKGSVEWPPGDGVYGKEHDIEIRVVEDDSELGFHAELADPDQETIRLLRPLQDTVVWRFSKDTPRGYGFLCHPKEGQRWPVQSRRYFHSAASLNAGAARPSTELPAGIYAYDIVVVNRLNRRGGAFVIDPEIVIDDDSVILEDPDQGPIGHDEEE